MDIPASGEHDDEIKRLLGLANTSPNEAVLESFALIDRELRAIAKRQGYGDPIMSESPSLLADYMADVGVITKQSATAVRGLSVLRDLAAHGGSDDQAPATRAREYVVYTQGLLYALRSPLRS